MQTPLNNNAVALVIHFRSVGVMLTAGNLNIYAVIWSNICLVLIVSVLNAIAIARFLHYCQEMNDVLIPVIVDYYGGCLSPFTSCSICKFLAIDLRAVCNPGRGGNHGIGLISFKGITVEEIAAKPEGTSDPWRC
ncbi:MAG: hypothetical protein ACLTSZ_06415 [Lachnospiraceae bacterium]